MLPVAGTDEELDLGEERLKVRDVWHGELHKSGTKKEGQQKTIPHNNMAHRMETKKHLISWFIFRSFPHVRFSHVKHCMEQHWSEIGSK